jgi:hypothetical protein
MPTPCVGEVLPQSGSRCTACTKRGLIHVIDTKGSDKGGYKPVNVYQAVISLSRGEGGEGGPIGQTSL